jgi:hypothetical protein
VNNLDWANKGTPMDLQEREKGSGVFVEAELTDTPLETMLDWEETSIWTTAPEVARRGKLVYETETNACIISRLPDFGSANAVPVSLFSFNTRYEKNLFCFEIK